MKKILLVLKLALICFGMSAQTNVGGFITSNTTWDLNGSPYIVIENILLTHGYTLTINPGVVVKFDDSCALQIDGEMDAIGTSQNHIIFTSNRINPHAGDWAKIHFSDSSNWAVFDTSGNYVSGCIMKYCDVMYAGGIGFGAIHDIQSSPYFSHCNILNSAAAGIYSVGNQQEVPAFRIDSSLIKNCSGYALNFQGFTYGLKVIDDTIENNNGGIYAAFGTYDIDTFIAQINGNYFISNTGHSAIRFPSGKEHLFIQENYFYNNTGSPVIYFDMGAGIYFDCNNLYLNNTTNLSTFMGYEGFFGSISNNIFNKNTSTIGSIINGIIGGNYLPLNFNDNIIEGNTSLEACCIFGMDSLFHLDSNQFVYNFAPIAISITGGNSTGIKYNNFLDPNCPIEMYNNNPYGQADIYADHNYWGTTNLQHIDSVVYDYFDYANLSVVYYTPVLSSQVIIDTSCIPNTLITGDKTINKQKNSSILLYPNPTSGTFTLSYNSQLSIQNSQLKIYDLLGEEVYTQAITKPNPDSIGTTITLPQLSNGVYFYQLTNNTETYRGKFVKE